MKTTLVPVSKCLVALGHSRFGSKNRKRLIKVLGIKVLGRVAYAKGIMDMMAREQMDQLVAEHKTAPKFTPAIEYDKMNFRQLREDTDTRFQHAFTCIQGLRDRLSHLEEELGIKPHAP